MNNTAVRIIEQLEGIAANISGKQTIIASGKVIQIIGMKIEVAGITATIGTTCLIHCADQEDVIAEVIGFSDKLLYLMAYSGVSGIRQGDTVTLVNEMHSLKLGLALLGRVIDADGKPIDGLGNISASESYSLQAKTINPLHRKKIDMPLDVGIRSINSLCTICKGQRLGIFAGSGVGKSVLLGMMTKFTNADVVVVALVGERGREVKEFIEEILGKEGLKKAIVVASPSDTSPLMRVKGASLATTIAEYFRDKGADVLLLMDSLTRYAQAQREISLSLGELPATKGYTPSVFAKLAQLVERTGNGGENQGSITALYSVLMEADDVNEPIADHVRSLLDGHIVLSRELADQAHYPAIDIEKSISRVMNNVVDKHQLEQANRFKNFYSIYQKNKELINIGMYQSGADKNLDQAILLRDKLNMFLKQDFNEQVDYKSSLQALNNLGLTSE
jgi:flagellum-specific ATP synthase